MHATEQFFSVNDYIITNEQYSSNVVNAKALLIMRCQDDINTEHNMKSIGRAAMAQSAKRLARNGQTRVRIREAHIFDITLPSRGTAVLSERVRGSIHRSESGRVRNLATTPP